METGNSMKLYAMLSHELSFRLNTGRKSDDMNFIFEQLRKRNFSYEITI